MVTVTEVTPVPQPITPGQEMEALARFHSEVTWTGEIEQNGDGARDAVHDRRRARYA
jgi:hypothetical protein